MNLSQLIFWCCAIGGTLFFLLNVAMTFIAGMHFDLGSHLPGANHSHVSSHDGMSGPDSAFKLLSLHSLTGFLMMFGWVGLACQEEGQMDLLVSLVLAGAAGFVTMYLTALLFRWAASFSSEGSKFNLNDAIGKRATVYQRISDGSRGQIQIVLGDVTHEVEAVSDTGAKLESQSTVEVVRVVDARTVSVKAV